MKVNKHIVFKEDSDYFINLLLVKKNNNTGILDTLENGEYVEGTLFEIEQYDSSVTAPSETKNKTVFGSNYLTGETESRLEEVKRYNINEPYKVGVNGVTEITSNYIKYRIDDITFITYINENDRTIYYFGMGSVIPSDNYPLFKDENKPFVDKRKTVNDIFIERNNISVIDNIVSISNIQNISDITKITQFEVFSN